MTYPMYETVDIAVNPALLSSLGLDRYTTIVLCPALESLFIEVGDPNILRNLQPDYNQLKKSSTIIKEVVVMAVSDDARYDFILRSFCPWIGINEDPVTGSVHSVLAHFWKERLGKHQMVAWQASERGGEVYVNALDTCVEIGGEVIPVAEGMLEV
jgi:PhzF family phenazine biosynthesis protein